MKTTLKTLSSIFFISLMLFACPLYSRAEKEAPTQTKDIQLLIGDDEVIHVSFEDIKERILKGEPVHFVEKQEEKKRTIKAEWITDALKKEYGVEEIDIKNAIITGDLDFHIKENLDGIEKSGMGVDVIKWLKDVHSIEKVNFISPTLHIEKCQLRGNLEAGSDNNKNTIVMFESSVSFSGSKFIKKADFRYANFKKKANFLFAWFMENANFEYASFDGLMSFGIALFKENADFREASFKEKAYFIATKFKGKTNFRYASFKEMASFAAARFYGKADFEEASFKKRVVFGTGSSVSQGGASFIENMARFYGEAYFGSASFDGVADFREASFEQKAYFKATKFKGKTNVNEASFAGGAIFSFASLEKANLRNVILTKSTFIDTNLKDAIFSGVDLTGSQ